MNCEECGDKQALFKYKGKIKADKHHTLCQKCYHNLYNSLEINSKFKTYLNWSQRRQCLEYIKENHTIILQTDNKINDNIYCEIKITPYRAYARFFDNAQELPNSIPDLVYNFNNSILKWINHWFQKVIDDNSLKQVNRVVIFWSDEENKGS